MALILFLVYIATAIAGGSFTPINLEPVGFLVQNNALVWQGQIWRLVTSTFIHADILHVGGNILFLLIFGTALEEQTRLRNWLLIYFGSGVLGSIAFLILGGQAIGVGASGAIWGLLGAAGGARGVIAMAFYGGLNIFAGGGFLAHAGGLIGGLLSRRLLLTRRAS